MILYFLRHGLAGDRATWTQEDGLRPLTQKGIDNMKQAAEKLNDLELGLDLILTSPLVRARQTAEIVAEELDMEDELVEDDRLAPGFDAQALLEILALYPDANALMVVGHEPDFSETISEITGGSEIVMKKGGLARVEIHSADPLRGELVWLAPAKVLIV